MPTDSNDDNHLVIYLIGAAVLLGGFVVYNRIKQPVETAVTITQPAVATLPLSTGLQTASPPTVMNQPSEPSVPTPVIAPAPTAPPAPIVAPTPPPPPPPPKPSLPSDCAPILASRDSRKAQEAARLAAYMASLTCTPSWNNQCGNNFPRPAPDTSDEARCDSFVRSCGHDAGGIYNPQTGACENITPWEATA
jgi:hypothetical protein